jgi:hypothetical protein
VGRLASSTAPPRRPQPRPPMEAKTAHTSQFFSTRQLSPAAFSELHTLAADSIDTKGPIEGAVIDAFGTEIGAAHDRFAPAKLVGEFGLQTSKDRVGIGPSSAARTPGSSSPSRCAGAIIAKPIALAMKPPGGKNLPHYALDRLSRYEATLWRQAGQILFALDVLGRRKPWNRRRRFRVGSRQELPRYDPEQC